MKRVSMVLLCGFIGGCATPSDSDLKPISSGLPTDRYLKQVSITLPTDLYAKVSDKMNTGREVATRLPAPFPDDYPPSRTIFMQDPRPYPSFTEPRYAAPAQNVVRFYDLKDVGETRTIMSSVKRLKKAMRERKSASQLKYPYPKLPDYPTHNASFLVQHKVSYHDYSWGSGVFFLVQFAQGPGNFPNNEELAYQFQGLSKDGRTYVSAAFRVTHPILPATMDARPESDDIDADADKMADRLDQQTDGSFSPGLSVIRSWIESIKLPQP